MRSTHSHATHEAALQSWAVQETSLEEALMRAIRSSPGSRSGELAEAVGLPRSNFGRRIESRLRQPLEELVAAGLVDEERGRYRLTDEGRKRIAERAS